MMIKMRTTGDIDDDRPKATGKEEEKRVRKPIIQVVPPMKHDSECTDESSIPGGRWPIRRRSIV